MITDRPSDFGSLPWNFHKFGTPQDLKGIGGLAVAGMKADQKKHASHAVNLRINLPFRGWFIGAMYGDSGKRFLLGLLYHIATVSIRLLLVITIIRRMTITIT